MKIYKECENCGMRFVSVFSGRRYCNEKECLKDRREKLRIKKIERNKILFPVE